jgi:nucleoid-associated protein YgaU
MIDANSRYYRSARATYAPSDQDVSATYLAGDGSVQATAVAADGNVIPYLKRRLLPQGDDLATVTVVTVAPGQRLDLLSARLQGDPLQFWRIADANNAMNPLDLAAVPGRQLRIPMPGR